MRPARLWSLPLLLCLISADDPANTAVYKNVGELLDANDRRLIRELTAYATANPKADDVDRAFMNLFETVIEHDWFVENEATARKYLADYAEGAVRPLAQIVATMGKAQGGDFASALLDYRNLMKGLSGVEQLEFASEFADSLASAASVAGEYDVSKKVYETLLERFGENPELADKVKDDLARIEMVGKPAPSVIVRDRTNTTFRLSDYKGKYVLIDFWATWCAPCVTELPNLQAAYKSYHEKGLEILSVSLDETTGPLNDFLKTHAMPWRQVHNPTCGADVAEAYGVNTIPATFLVGPDGNVVRLELRGTALQNALSALIK